MAGWLALYPLCLIVCGAVLADTASGLVTSTNPALALRINPLNSAARIDLAIAGLVRGSADGARSARALAAAGIRWSPADARFYSLLGLAELQRGDRRQARLLFGRALERLPAEFQALTHELEFAIEAQDPLKAVDHLEVLARRWPGRWPMVEKALPVVLSDGRAFEEVAKRFADEPRLRRIAIESLSGSAQTLPLAYRLVMTWFDGGGSDLSGQINRLTARFIEEKRYAQAFLLFRLTRTAADRQALGYVYNGGFDLPPSGNPFDWHLRHQAGVDLRIATEPEPRGAGVVPHKGGGLVVRFLDNPIRFRNVWQWLRLAPARYRLVVRYAAQKLKTPRPLKIALTCRDRAEPLAEIAFESGTFDAQEAAADFAVPVDDCALQLIRVLNDPMPMSWRNRYDGTLYLENVSIRRVER